jgi:hypothetical protein
VQSIEGPQALLELKAELEQVSSLERSERRGLLFVMPVNTVDLTFEQQRERRHCTLQFEQLLLLV